MVDIVNLKKFIIDKKFLLNIYNHVESTNVHTFLRLQRQKSKVAINSRFYLHGYAAVNPAAHVQLKLQVKTVQLYLSVSTVNWEGHTRSVDLTNNN